MHILKMYNTRSCSMLKKVLFVRNELTVDTSSQDGTL